MTELCALFVLWLYFLVQLRFGETNLHNCEVMLKDLADSKRINANIKSSPAALRNSIAAAQSASLFCASMLNMSGGQDSLLRGPASSIPSMLASLLPSTSTSAAGSSSGSSAQITTRTQRQGSAAGQLPNLPSGQAALSSGTMAATIAGLAANQNLGAHLDPNTRLALLRARMHALRTAASAAALEGPLAFGVGGGGAGGGLPWAGDKDDDDMLTVDMIDATIVSALFWPPFQGESIKLPEAVQGLLDAYAARYHALKAPRKLQWKTQLGTVKLELEFEDRTVQFTVSPVHAVLVMHFEKTNRWLSSDLAEAVGVPVGAVRKKMSFWVNQGVVTEAQAQTGGEITYTVVETLGESGGKAGTACGAAEGAVMLEEEEGESAVASIEDQRQHELEVYEVHTAEFTALNLMPAVAGRSSGLELERLECDSLQHKQQSNEAARHKAALPNQPNCKASKYDWCGKTRQCKQIGS
ncbi:hypothetical protein CBR_g545 [Chara braunii]|uniref:Cullin family profile domain-containing protein n=1 Tax=Chara braunii TaxID=69332 RepID=A0A388KBK5_CHABU|nr:hypothetical protein CBR_g545 [Chara braunii]|eukprot:GBG67409.1 hypothetical protein CBR_g545 [Chara braunii]